MPFSPLAQVPSETPGSPPGAGRRVRGRSLPGSHRIAGSLERIGSSTTPLRRLCLCRLACSRNCSQRLRQSQAKTGYTV